MEKDIKAPSFVSFEILLEVMRSRMDFLVRLPDSEFNYIRDLVNQLENNRTKSQDYQQHHW